MPSKLKPEERLKLIERVILGKEPAAKVCREAGISRVLFYRWLKRYKEAPGTPEILTPGRRKKVLILPKAAKRAKKLKKRRYPELSPEEKLHLIKRVEAGEEVADVCREKGISRTIFYRWKKRYQEAPAAEKMEALKPQERLIRRYFRQTPEKYEQAVLSLVAEHPEYGVRKLVANLPYVAGVPIVGHHGVQNILRRYNLSLYEQRLAYSQAQVTPVTRVISTFEQVFARFFIFPLETRVAIVRFLSVVALTTFSTVVVLGGLGYFAIVFGRAAPIYRPGLIFASIALSVGSLFFLYSMKYYFTLAIVLSFSRQPGEPAVLGLNGRLNGPTSPEASRGWLARIFGLRPNGPIGPEGLGNGKERKVVGLEPNLESVKLKKYPFVSIHLPFYNEKKVADRILSACTSMDYENYEVVVVDDSTDETVKILEKWKSHPKVKIIHRETRAGFKGGALGEALKHMDPRTEFITVFDADFIPYPDTLELFLKYFKTYNDGSEDYSKSNIACVAGYQWHVLNKSENWITRGVRTEYSGSYVIERSGQEVLGAMKLIHGSVYAIRADVLKKFGWGTSITEDFELTLKLYEQGYKVVYTPYIQAPAECVSTIKRLIRQRMRWAEGHSHNIRNMFLKLLRSPRMTLTEKLEFLYLSPYYLQAFFFLVGTFSWLMAETIFRARLPFWTSLWGWSLVLTNFFSLPLVNAVGLFLEESEERDYLGLLSFVAISYILVPFQAYASVKGFLEKEEGPWFRTPKTGLITDIFTRGRFYRWISGILPGRLAPVARMSADRSRLALSPYVALATANNRFDGFSIKKRRMRWFSKAALASLLIVAMLIHQMAFNVQPVEATWYSDTNYQYRKKLTIDNTLVSGSANLSNFPVLVSYSDPSLRTTANGGRVTNSSGFDIIFTDDDKTTKLDHEIEKYTSTASTGTIVFWVRIPTLPYNTDKDFYIYYGNSNISTSQENISGVWTGWSTVTHLSKTGNDFDSVSGTSAYVQTGTVSSVTGKIGNARNSDDGDLNYLLRVTFTDPNPITVMGWVNFDTLIQATYGRPMSREPSGAGGLDWEYPTVSGGNLLRWWDGASIDSVSGLALDTWYFITTTNDGTTGRIYINGSQDYSASQTHSDMSANPLYLFRSGKGTARQIDGMIDEFRMYAGELSAGYIMTCFNNQNNQGTGSGKFIKTLSVEEEIPELVVLLIPVALVMPIIIKYLRRKPHFARGFAG